MPSFRTLRELAGLLPRWARLPTYRAGNLLAQVGFPSVDVVWLRGRLRHSGQPACLLVAGKHPWALYMPDRLLQLGFSIEPVTRVRLPGLPRVLQAHREQADLTLVRMDRAWTRMTSDPAYLRVPEWVGSYLALPDDLQAYLHSNESRASDVRRLRNQGYTYELSHSAQDLDTFREHFHAPLIRRRHGGQAVVAPLRLLRRWLSRGGLLWVLHHGRRVAAVLFVFEAGGLHPVSSGCADQPEARAGFAGTYVFLFMHAHALGMRQLNLGGCRPTTQDGVVRYKRKWGARLAEKHHQYTDLHLWWQRPSLALRELFQHTPLVFRDRGGFSQIGALGTHEQAHVLANALRTPGLDRLILLGGEALAGGPADLIQLEAGSSRELLLALKR